nr:unnamed protein product [Callosobruchus analis]
MGSRSKRIVDLALQVEKHTDSWSSSEAFSSFDSDFDPTMKSYLIVLTYQTQEKEQNIKIRIQKREVNSKPQQKEADQNRRTRTRNFLQTKKLKTWNLRRKKKLLAKVKYMHPVGNHQVFDYSAESGLHADYAATLINDLSTCCFRSIVDDKIIDEMHTWVWLGLEKYWSNDELFHISIIPRIIPRNRFQLLLRMWHFSNNEYCPEGDRLYKIKPLLDALYPMLPPSASQIPLPKFINFPTELLVGKILDQFVCILKMKTFDIQSGS